MYTISILNPREVNASEVLLYSDESPLLDFKLETAELSLKEGSAGSLKLKVAPSHPNYGAFFYADGEPKTLALVATVRKETSINGVGYTDVLFTGRLIEVNTDFNNNITVTFEGAYNYLLDTIQTPYTNTTTPSLWFLYMVGYHNTVAIAANEPWKCINTNHIDQSIDSGGNFTFYANNESSLTMVNNVIEGWSAHPVFDYVDETAPRIPIISNNQVAFTSLSNLTVPLLSISLYKNYRTDTDPPEIIFGENLLDYTRECKNEEPATVIIPLGDAYDEEKQAEIIAYQAAHPNEPNIWLEPAGVVGLEMRRSIYSVNTIGGNRSQYLYDESDQNFGRFGYICKTVEFETGEGDDAYAKLLAYGQKYLQDQKWNKTTLGFSAFDLTLLGYNYKEIKMGVNVHCLSEPHDLNKFFPCTAMNINLLDISASTYTLGDDSGKYISDSARKTDEKLRDAVMQGVNRERLLEARLNNEINGPNGSVQQRFDAVDEGMTNLSTRLQGEIDSIVSGPDALVEIAKNNALSLLNIYDAERNPVNKGYVHFVKEDVNYNPIDIKSIDQLKDIFKSHCRTNSTSYNNAETFFNSLKTMFYDENGDPDPNYIIMAIISGTPYYSHFKMMVMVYEANATVKIRNNGMFTGEYIRSYAGMYANEEDTYFAPTIKINASAYEWQGYKKRVVFGNRGGNHSWVWFSTYDAGLPGYAAERYAWYESDTEAAYAPTPNKVTLNNTNFSIYVNRDIYDTDGITILKQANLTLETEPEPEQYNDHITEIVISDTLDYLDSNAGCWRWNKTGLYFLSNGYHPSDSQHVLPDGEYGSPTGPLRLALTRDGHIVADHITAGKLDAGIIRAGVLLAGEDPNNAKFQLNIQDGNMIANKARLVFNNLDQKTGDKTSPSSAVREFAYFSNQKCGEYISVGGKNSNEWMLIVGNGFGVDGFGRTVMREADIGGTGGIFDVAARNEDFVTCEWVEGSSTDTLKFKIEINSDSYRPSFVSDASEYAECHYYWALGVYDANGTYYASNDPDHEHPIKKVSAINDLVFNPGWKSVTYEDMDFSPAITRTHGSSDANPYYAGQLFPIFFKSNGTEVETDYQVFAEDKTPDGQGGYLDQYRGYSGRHWKETSVDSSGTIHIGSGYLENGTTGQNKSFYLGGIKRSATVAQNARTDWRFTVGSNFGVTENGNLYCHDSVMNNATLNGATLRNITADSSVFRNASVKHLTVDTITNINLRDNYYTDGYSQFLDFKVETISLFTSLTSVKFSTAVDGQGQSMSKDYDGTTLSNAFSGLLKSPILDVSVVSEFRTRSTPTTFVTEEVAHFTWTIDKASGTTNNFFFIHNIDSSNWNVHPDDVGKDPQQYSYGYNNYTVFAITLVNRVDPGETDQRPTFTGYYTQASTAVSAEHPIEGSFIIESTTADNPHACVKVAQPLLVSQIGAPRNYVSTAYITNIDNGSSRLYKENITPIEQRYDVLFDHLRPVVFDYRHEFMPVNNKRKGHTGFIMEEVKEAMDKADISPEEFAAYSPSDDGVGGGLSYINFIALNTWEIQKLKRENDELKDRLSKLEAALYEKDILD